jgi:hypothetical protein
VLLEQVREAVERRRGTLHGAIDVPIEQRQHRFGKPCEVPLRERGWLPYAYRPPWSMELNTVAGSYLSMNAHGP